MLCKDKITAIFCIIDDILKEICCQMEYIIDSFPVEICKNIRINRSKIVQGKHQWYQEIIFTNHTRCYFERIFAQSYSVYICKSIK